MASVTGTTTRKVNVSKIKKQSNFERYAYLFMRASGVGLLILAVGHMFLQHVFNSAANLNMQFVAAQWDSWGWKAYDIMLLWLAIPHGVNGLRNVVGDYVHNESRMRLISTVLVVFVIVTVIWATIGMVLFDSAPYL